MAGPCEALVELRAEGRIDREPLVARRATEQRVVETEQAAQLDERIGMVVNAEVDEGVRESRVATVALDDQQRGGLAAPAVPPAASAASRQSSSRSASVIAGVASNVSASASTVAPETRMFPCAA